jgi:hypothetical protein
VQQDQGNPRADEVSERTIRAAASGRHLAFEAIVRTYDARLRGLAYAMLHSPRSWC